MTCDSPIVSAPLHSTPSAEIQARIHALQTQLVHMDIGAALILQNTDLYYFSGTIQQGHLWVPAVGEPLLLVRKSLPRAQAESPIAHIAALGSPKELPALLTQFGLKLPQRLGLELDVLPTNLFLSYQELLPTVKLCDISHMIRLLRAVKSPYEIALIEKAATLADQVFAAVPELVREGMSEIELAGLIEARARRLGHQGIVRMRLWGSELFYGHLLCGPSGGVPSYLQSPTGGTGINAAVAQGAGRRPIGRHEPILVDYVFALDGYLADQTRLFSLGALPDELLAAHRAMLSIQSRLQRAGRPGISGGQLYDMACASAAELGYAPQFMGATTDRIRFVGHGVGLELDEYPFLAKGQKLPLAAGMVVALEPKAIFPGLGVVGIENTHEATEQGLRPLTRYPQDVTVI